MNNNKMLNEVNHQLGGNSKHDKYGNQYSVTIRSVVLSHPQNLLFENRYEMLNFIKLYKNNSEFEIMSHSSTGSDNVDNENII